MNSSVEKSNSSYWFRLRERRAWYLWPLLFFIVVAVLILVLPMRDWLIAILHWCGRMGPAGAVVLGVIYVLACLLFLPTSVLGLGAGFVFGLSIGTVTISLGRTLGACAAFALGRTAAKRWIATQMTRSKRFTALSEAVGRRGFVMVFLSRLCPLFEFHALNYVLGLTKVQFGKYLLATWLGTLPGVVTAVYLGSAARSVADSAVGMPGENGVKQILFWGGLVICGTAMIVITRLAGRELKHQMKTDK